MPLMLSLLGVLLTFIVSVWLMLIFMSYSSQVVFRLFVRFCNLFSFARLWSSANNISFKSSGSGFASFVTLSMYTMNSSGDRTHPCLTPGVSWNQSVSPVGVRTELMLLALMLSRSCPFMLYVSRTLQSLSLLTLSKAFSWSTKTRFSFGCTRLPSRLVVVEQRWHLCTLFLF